MKAKAAVFMGANKPFEVRQFQVTATPAGYGRSRLIASGICGTDLHFHNGKLAIQPPTIIGHEFVGTLEDCDEREAAEHGLKVGDHVIADIAVPCGKCLLCQTGDDANCIHMAVTNGGSIEQPPYLYGGYTEVNYTPLKNLIRIPEELDPTVAAVFACPGPTAVHAFRLAKQAGVVLKEKKVAVVQGLGPVGCFAVLYLKALGVPQVCAITAGDNPIREELAKKLGADEVFNLTRSGEEAVTEQLQAKNGGLGVDLCFEASGAPKAVWQGMSVLRNRGVYLIPGQYSNSGAVEIQPQLITFKALHMIGSSQYSVCDVQEYLKFLCHHGELHKQIAALSKSYTIPQINQAFVDAKSGDNVKTLLVPEA